MYTRHLISFYTSLGQGGANIFGVLYSDPKRSFLRIGRQIHPANWSYDVVANKPFEIFLTILSIVGRKLSEKIIISYDTRGPEIHLTVSHDTGAGICVSLHSMVEQGTAAIIRQP